MGSTVCFAHTFLMWGSDSLQPEPQSKPHVNASIQCVFDCGSAVNSNKNFKKVLFSYNDCVILFARVCFVPGHIYIRRKKERES